MLSAHINITADIRRNHFQEDLWVNTKMIPSSRKGPIKNSAYLPYKIASILRVPTVNTVLIPNVKNSDSKRKKAGKDKGAFSLNPLIVCQASNELF